MNPGAFTGVPDTPGVLLALDVLAAALNAILGLLVLFRAPKGRVQQAFATFALAVSLWSWGIVGLDFSATLSDVMRASTVTFVGGSLMAAALVWFAALFPGSRQSPGPHLRLFVAVGFLACLVSPLDLYVKTSRPHPLGWEPVSGPLSPLFGIYFALAAGYFLFSLGRRWHSARGLERLQTQYLLLGLLLFLAVGVTTNIVIPQILPAAAVSAGSEGGDHFLPTYTFGPIASFIFVLFSGYSIARFHLLEIGGVLRKSLAYGLTLIALGMAFIVAVVEVNHIAMSHLGSNSPTVQAVVAMVLAILFQPAYRFFQNFVNILFFRKAYDYAETLRTLSRSMTLMLDLQQLREHLSESVVEFMQVERSSIVICRSGHWEMNGELWDTQLSNNLLDWLKQGQIVIREMVGQNEHDPISQRIVANMDLLEADVAVPLLLKEDLTGILLVGPKRAGTVFSNEDIALLSTVANQAAIALRNAQLYLEIRSSQRYTQSILEHLDSAVLTVAADGTPVVTNDAARRLLPCLEGNVVLPPILRFVVRRVCHSQQEEANLEFDLVDPSGNLTPVLGTVCPFVTETGQVETALIVVRDISVLRRLEDERLRSEKLSSLSRVASQLAHEIRNPLASIKTFCQLLPEKYRDVEFREGFSQLALQEVERIDSLVSNLLSVDKPARGAWEKICMQDIVTSTVQWVQPMLLEDHLRLEFECDPDLPEIMGDQAQIRQLFLNLLLNAQHAAPSHSTIRVRLVRGAAGEVVGEVSNGGSPIPPADLPLLFEPFFTTRKEGTGLGLTVCRQVAEYHQGTITVQSSEESGTIFRFTVPPVETRAGVPQ